jgi:hypothetical protein
MWRFVLLGVLVCVGGARAQELPSDAALSSFPFRRAVTVSKDAASGFAVVALPPELSREGEGVNHRLVSRDGQEIPFVIGANRRKVAVLRHAGHLIDTHSQETPEWTVDLNGMVRFERIEFDFLAGSFAGHATISVASEQAGPYRTVAKDVPLFDVPWQTGPGGRLQFFSTQLAQTETARFVRVSFVESGTKAKSHRTSPPVLRMLVALHKEERPGRTWEVPVELQPVPAVPSAASEKRKTSRYKLVAPEDLPFVELAFSAQDPAFVRTVRLLQQEGNTSSGTEPKTLRTLHETVLFRVSESAPLPTDGKPKGKRDSDWPLSVSAQRLALTLAAPPEPGPLFVEVEDMDSPPLASLSARAFGVAAQLFFPLDAAAQRSTREETPALFLYHGSATAKPQQYDLAELSDSLAQLLRLAPASLALPQPNPRFRKTPPLPAVPTQGSPLSVADFRYEQPLLLTGGVDLYSVLLSPLALSFAQSNLADVRIVDSDGLQVPYVLFPSARKTRASFSISEAPAAEKTTRFRLTSSYKGKSVALPLSAVELSFTSRFYRRTFRFLDGSDPKRDAPVLLQGTLERLSEEDAGLHRVPLPEQFVKDLLLEVENGDNPPLLLERAWGVVSAPRLLFKADGTKTYKLLLGNPGVAAPSYDLASLREVLAEQPTQPATVGEVAAFPGFRPPSEAKTHMSLLMFGVLVLSVLVLAGLSLRLLRQPAKDHPGENASDSGEKGAGQSD